MYFLYEFWCLLRAFLIYIFLIFLLVYWKIARSHRDIDDFSFCSQRSFWGTLPLSLLLMEFWTYWHRTPTCPPTTSASSKTSKRDRTEASPLSSSHPRWCVALFFSSQYDFIVYVGVFLAEVSRQCGSVFLQEASQLLTILQSLQPPLKLDGKTVGVDFAKSARKCVIPHIHNIYLDSLFYIRHIFIIYCTYLLRS